MNSISSMNGYRSNYNMADTTTEMPIVEYLHEMLGRDRSAILGPCLERAKNIKSLDEATIQQMQSSELQELRSICPNLHESYLIPIADYIKEALVIDSLEGQDLFLERAKNITSLDEATIKQMQSYTLQELYSIYPNVHKSIIQLMRGQGLHLQKLRSICPDLHKSYCMPIADYLKKALKKQLSESEDPFFERAKNITSLDEATIKQMQSTDLQKLHFICPNLPKSYLTPITDYVKEVVDIYHFGVKGPCLERAKKLTCMPEHVFQKMVQDGKSNLFSIFPNLHRSYLMPIADYIKKAIDTYTYLDLVGGQNSFLERGKNITSLDEATIQRMQIFDLQALIFLCPNLHKSYRIPIADYLKEALEKQLSGSEDPFLERAKNITSLDEATIQQMQSTELQELRFICPNLPKSYLTPITDYVKEVVDIHHLEGKDPFLERAEKLTCMPEHIFQKMVQDGKSNLFSIFPNLHRSYLIPISKYLKDALEKQPSGGEDPFLERAKNIISLDEIVIQQMQQSDLQKLCSICPNLAKSYLMPIADYLKEAIGGHLAEGKDPFLERAKNITSLDEATIQQMQSSELQELRSICLNLPKSYLMTIGDYLKEAVDIYHFGVKDPFLERAEKLTCMPEHIFQKMGQDGESNLSSICPNLHSSYRMPISEYLKVALEKQLSGGEDLFLERAQHITTVDKAVFQGIMECDLKELPSLCPNLNIYVTYGETSRLFPLKTLNTIEFFSAIFKHGYKSDLQYHKEDEQLSIDLKEIYPMTDYINVWMDSSLKTSQKLSILSQIAERQLTEIDIDQFFNFLEKPTEFNKWNIKQVIELNKYFSSKIVTDAFHSFLLKNSHTEEEKEILGILLTETEYGDSELHIGAFIGKYGIDWLRYGSARMRDDLAYIEPLIKKYDLKAYSHSSERIQNMPEIALRTIKNSTFHLAKGLHDNLEFIKAAVRINPEVIEYAAKELQNNIDVAYALIDGKMDDNRLFKHLGPDILDDFDFIQTAAHRHRYSVLEFASERIRNMNVFMLAAISKNYIVVYYLGQKLRRDLNFIKKVAQIAPQAARLFPQDALNNLDIVYTLVQQNLFSIYDLQYLGADVRDNLEFMQAVCCKYGSDAIPHASDRVRTIIGNSVPTTSIICQQLSELRGPRYAVEFLTKNPPERFQDSSHSNRDQEDIAYALLKIGDKDIIRNALQHIGSRLQNNIEFIQAASAALKEPTIQYASNQLKKDLRLANDLLTTHSEENKNALQHIGPIVRNNAEFMQKAIELYGVSVIKLASSRVQKLLAYTGSTLTIKSSSQITEIFFQTRYYSSKQRVATEIKIDNREYELLRTDQKPYPWVQKIRLIAISFFSLGLALFSKSIRTEWAMMLDGKKIEAIYGIQDKNLTFELL